MQGLSERHVEEITKRGIDVELAAKFGLFSDGQWLVFPYVAGDKVVNHKFRTLGEEKRFRQDANAVKTFFNANAITDPSLADQPLIVTEGEFDALAAIQCGFARTVSVPDGAPAERIEGESAKYSYLAENRGALGLVGEFILAVDGDGPGINLLNDLALRLGKARCKWVTYPLTRDRSRRLKDLNEVLLEYGQAGVTLVINRAQWMRVDGVYRMSELPPLPERQAFDIGLPTLKDHYRMRLGDFCVVTGIPSHGKTSVVNELACRMALNYRWNVAFASFEQKPQVDHRRNLRTYFNRAKVIHQTDDEIRVADDWIDERFTFIVPSEDDDVTLAWTLERCAAAIVQRGCKLVIIDPWNEMDHIRPPDMSLTDYTGFAIKQFRKLADKHMAHVIVVAHPTKLKKLESGHFAVPSLYDISDSAHWYNKPDVGLVVHRKDESKTLIRIAKSRYHDQIGRPGDIEVIFNPDDNHYTVIEDTNGSLPI